MKTALVTGGAGFVGSHLVEALVKKNIKVRILDDLTTGSLKNIEAFLPHLHFIKGSILDAKKLKEACRGVDVVFHQAARVSVQESIEKPVEVHNTNLTGTLNALKAAKACRVKKFVFASSAAVYGDNGKIVQKEDSEKCPISPYGIQKLAAEYYLSFFNTVEGIETISLRYFNIFGARQNPRSDYAGVLTRFVECFEANRTPVLFGDGRQTRDFIYIKDVVNANLLAAKKNGIGGEVLNIGTGRETSLLRLVEMLSHLFGRTVKPTIKPARKGDIMHSRASIEKAQHDLGFIPQYSLEKGLKEMVGVYR